MLLGRFNAGLPEANAVGQPFSVRWAGHRLRKKLGRLSLGLAREVSRWKAETDPLLPAEQHNSRSGILVPLRLRSRNLPGQNLPAFRITLRGRAALTFSMK